FSSRRRHTRSKRDWSSTCALPIYLVFPDQDHAARIYDVGAVLDKIAACPRDLVIDLKFMMDMETGHVIARIPVDPLYKKVILRAVGIFRNHRTPLLAGRSFPPYNLFCHLL